MNQMNIQEFSRWLKMSMSFPESRFCFFLGAGCSVSSGIPTAGTLVKQWMPKLKQRKTGSEDNAEEWAKKNFSEYDGKNAARYYGKIIKELFLTPQFMQEEIERIVQGKDPGFGYAVLAQLVSHEEYGKHFNFVLTTNFDDMVTDALYLFTNKKPLVIVHESLIGFVRISRSRPVLIKIHGDARLSPKNTEDETEKIDEAAKKVIQNLLTEMGIIFVGYGGNDHSIWDILNELPPDALPSGVYWVNSEMPDEKMQSWLKKRNATWVNHLDFDELMLLIRNEFELGHPDHKRFEKITRNYQEKFNSLMDKVEKRVESTEKKVLEEAAQKAAREFKDWWAVELETRKYQKTDPEKADEIYRQGLENFPDSKELFVNYANFLTIIYKNYDRAEEFYTKALEINLNDAINLGAYAYFLDSIREEYDRAEQLYHKALEADPNYAINLGNYANFLYQVRKDYDRAEEFYKKTLATDSNYTTAHRNYAIFLENIRKDYDQADEFYHKAIEADPKHANTLGYYANFLTDKRKDYERAEEFYLKALKADPNHANNLGNYANFLRDVRKNYERAEEFYRKALDTDSNHANNLGNCAGFLLARGKPQEGFSLLSKAIELAKDFSDLMLECCFYQYAHTAQENEREESLTELKKLIASDVRSPGWNLEDNVKRAIADGHPEPEFLTALAKVISDEQDAKELGKFEVWKKVKLKN